MNNNKGFSLVEIILALGFIAVAITVSIIAYNKANFSFKLNSEQKKMAVLVENVRNRYANQENYHEADLIDNISDIAPQEMIDERGLYHKLTSDGSRGGMSIRPRNSNSPSSPATYGRYFGLSYANIGSKYCVPFIIKVAPMFDMIKTSNIILKSPTSPELDLEQLETVCSDGISGMAFITL